MQAKTLDEYLTRYGPMLGANADSTMAPLHNPDTDPLPDFSRYKRKPFPAQAHRIAAMQKVLDTDSSVWLNSQMGTGKTLMAIEAIDGRERRADGSAGYRAIVMCPGHIVNKWREEILTTLADARVTMLESCHQLPGIWKRRHEPEDRPHWYVIGRDRAKLDSEWKPAVIRYKKLWKKRPGLLCPECHGRQVDNAGNYLPIGYFEKAQRKCKCQVVRLKLVAAPGGGRKWEERKGECGCKLYRQIGKAQGGVNRFEPAKFIQKKLRRYFDYYVLDEAHEEKATDSDQGEAAGKLVSAAKKSLALTGTLIGGQANHVRALMLRFSPQSLLAEGLGWSNPGAFDKRYGRIEKVYTETSGETDKSGKYGGRRSGRNVSERVRPGVSPVLFGRHLLGKTVYMELEQISDQLPPRYEYTWPVEMDAQQAAEYERLDNRLREVNAELLREGNRGLLGAMLQTLLTWVDYPFDWQEQGYWLIPGKAAKDRDRKREFVPVVQPAHLSAKLRPKEKKLLELVKAEVKSGRQVWVYVQNTEKHDVQRRLVEILQDEGIETTGLRSSVEPAKREEWIKDNGRLYQCIVSHADLVKTGLDLFDKKGRHNFPTLIFYETGYNAYTLRQAAARSWRIGQRYECRTHYLYYAGTMQEAAMVLMGQKIAAAQALEGKFSSEGLVAMGGDDVDMEMALAKAIDKLLPGEAVQLWGKGVGAAHGDLADPNQVFKAEADPYASELWEEIQKMGEVDDSDLEGEGGLDEADIAQLLGEVEADMDGLDSDLDGDDDDFDDDIDSDLEDDDVDLDEMDSDLDGE